MLDKIKRLQLIFIALLFSINVVWGQDIKGGEIIYTNLSINSYMIDIYLYTKTSLAINHSRITIGASDTLTGVFTNLPNDITEWHYPIIHTFSGPGIFNINALDSFRIAGIQNISNSSAEKILLTTIINNNPFLGSNNSPVFINRQTNVNVSGGNFFHDASAYVFCKMFEYYGLWYYSIRLSTFGLWKK